MVVPKKNRCLLITPSFLDNPMPSTQKINRVIYFKLAQYLLPVNTITRMQKGKLIVIAVGNWEQ